MNAFEDFGEALDACAVAAANFAKTLNLVPSAWVDEFRRRQQVERELGYAVPDWVWRVREQQREQFGSGNGRDGEGL